MIEQLNFYMTKASPDLLESRREYIERVIVGKLRRGIEEQKQWSQEMRSQPDSIELINAYKSGLEFFTRLGFASNKEVNNDGIEIPESFDPEWQQTMLRQLAGNIEALKEREDDPDELLIDCEEIIEALREYSGY